MTDARSGGGVAGREALDPSDRDLAEAVGTAMMERNWTVSLAESCTGGLVLALLTAIPGCSRYVVGGVVAYADRIKTELLGVDPELLARHGAVSGETAILMARGVSRTLGTQVGASVTGIAGPGGEVPGKPVGTVWFGLALPEGLESERVRFEGDRAQVRAAAARHVLRMLRDAATGADVSRNG